MLTPVLRTLKYMFGAYIIYRLFLWILAVRRRWNLTQQAAAKRQERDRKQVETPYVAEEKQHFILSLTGEELLLAIKTGRVSSLEATATYINRAFTIGRDLELTAEEPFEEALALARERDRQLEESPSSCGKLHGLPISLKDQFQQVGCHSGCGVVHRALQPDEANAAIVERLLSEGAVPFVRSNLTQSMMWIECVNNIYGQAKNPWNLKCTPGGSSGGEAGLIASRCSVLGIGTDIAGSIRIPAAFCGVYGLKPTPLRVSRMNVRTASPQGVEPLGLFVPAACGPIGRTVDDLKIATEVLFSTSKIDIFLENFEFNQAVYNESLTQKKLKIGYYTDVYFFECVPAVRRAILECKEALANEGHELVEFKPPNFDSGMKLFLDAYSSFGDAPLLNGLQGERPMHFYNLPLLFWRYPLVKKFLMFVFRNTGNQRLADYLNVRGTLSIPQVKKLYDDINQFIQALTEYWVNLELDAIICPVIGNVGVTHSKTTEIVTTLAYGFVWNLAKYPGGVVPVSLVRANEDQYPSQYQDLISKRAKKVCRNTEGMPVAVQVVGLPYQDEKVLAVMKRIENIFSFHKFAM